MCFSLRDRVMLSFALRFVVVVCGCATMCWVAYSIWSCDLCIVSQMRTSEWVRPNNSMTLQSHIYAFFFLLQFNSVLSFHRSSCDRTSCVHCLLLCKSWYECSWTMHWCIFLSFRPELARMKMNIDVQHHFSMLHHWAIAVWNRNDFPLFIWIHILTDRFVETMNLSKAIFTERSNSVLP